MSYFSNATLSMVWVKAKITTNVKTPRRRSTDGRCDRNLKRSSLRLFATPTSCEDGRSHVVSTSTPTTRDMAISRSRLSAMTVMWVACGKDA